MDHKNDRQLIYGSLLTYLQMGASIVIGLLYTPFILRTLGQEEYGLYSTIASTISLLSILSLGFGSSYVRYFMKYRTSGDEDGIARLNGLYITVFSVIGVIALACGFYLTAHMELLFGAGLKESQHVTARILMILLAVNLGISFPMSVFNNYIIAHERYVFLKLTSILNTVVSPLITLPVLLLGYGSIGMTAVTVIVSAVVYVIQIAYCRKELRIRITFRNLEKGLVKEIAIFSSFIAINIIVDQINNNLDKVIITRFAGTAAAAVYAIGQQINIYYTSFSTAISGMFTPRIHAIVQSHRDDTPYLRRELTELFIRVGRLQFFLLSLILTGFIFFGRPFIQLWAGEGYEGSYPIALLLLIPGTVPLIQNIGIEIQRAQNLHHYRSILYGSMAVLNLIISIYLCKRLGALGCAIGTAVAVLLANGLAMNILYQKKINIDVAAFWRDILKTMPGMLLPILCGVLMALFLDLYRLPVMLLGIVGYAAVFAASVWRFSMNAEEKALVVGLLKKGRTNE